MFGYVIETDNNLIVVDSSQETTIIPGEPVNWRLFPNTKYYTNHMSSMTTTWIFMYLVKTILSTRNKKTLALYMNSNSYLGE